MPTSDDQARGDESSLPAAQPEADTESVALEIAASDGDAVLVDLARMQGDMIDFAQGRWQEVLETSGSLLQCRGDAAQAYALQVGFACRATEQYLEQAGKLMVLAQTLARCWWWPTAWMAGCVRDPAVAA